METKKDFYPDFKLDMLVLHCYITSYHKLSNLKHKCIILQFLFGHESGYKLAQSSAQGLKVSAWLNSYVRLWVLFQAHWLLAEFSS